MLRFTVILIVFAVSQVAYGEDSPGLKSCLAQFPGKPSNAYRMGCSIGETMAKEPELAKYKLSCSQLCQDKFVSGEPLKDCTDGCEKFPAENKKDESGLSGLFGALNMLPVFQAPLAPMDNEEPHLVKVTRVRIFSPTGEFPDIPKMLQSVMNRMFSSGPQLINGNDPMVSRQAAPVPVVTAEQPHVATSHGFCHRIRMSLQGLAVDPIRLLLIVTIVILVTSLICQVIVHCVRQKRRSHIHQYTPLPTYTEAIGVKVPLLAEDYEESMVKPSKKADVLDA